MAHSLQVIGLLVGAAGCFFAVPIIGRIHEGVTLSNRDKRTLPGKMNEMAFSLGLPMNFYFVADAYYACKGTILGLVAKGNHLISRCRTNTVAYLPAPEPKKRKRGRPRLYGEKIALKSFFSDLSKFIEVECPREPGTKIKYLCLDFLWKPIRGLARFVLVVHPTKGRWILIGTDLSLDPMRMIELYALRFRIELCFKQLVYLVHAFAYRFWMKAMKKTTRGSNGIWLHRSSEEYRQRALAKVRAYCLHVQLGMIALGLLQWLALSCPKKVWASFGSWMRTMRTDAIPSELVAATAMRSRLRDFLTGLPDGHAFAKFLRDKIDFDRLEVFRSAA